MSSENATSIRLSDVDKADLEKLIKYNVFTHQSDAIKGVFRRGIQEIMDERGIEPTKVMIPEMKEVEA